MTSRRQEIAARLEAATAGSWRVEDDGGCDPPSIQIESEGDPLSDWVVHEMFNAADAEFIAHAPEDIRWLFARVDTLEHEAGLAMRDLGTHVEDAHVQVAFERLRDVLAAPEGAKNQKRATNE